MQAAKNAELQVNTTKLGQDSVVISQVVKAMLQEAEAIVDATKHLSASTKQLLDLILATKGKLIFSGAGKSGLIAQKLVSTFSSLGMPAIFLHPNDAIHGDLGVIQKNDLFIALSKSGTGLELENIFSYLHLYEVKICLICCVQGALAQKAHVVVSLPCEREICHLNLAPTSSSTIMLAFGDAIATVASKIRGFSSTNFAMHHPAGALGKKLLMTVHAFMHYKQDLPILEPETQFQDLLVAITGKKLGIGVVVDEQENLLGIITDGDLRRACKIGPEVFKSNAGQIMTHSPKTIDANQLAKNALETMEQHNVTSLIVTSNDKKVLGLVHIHDLIKAGLRG